MIFSVINNSGTDVYGSKKELEEVGEFTTATSTGAEEGAKVARVKSIRYGVKGGVKVSMREETRGDEN